MESILRLRLPILDDTDLLVLKTATSDAAMIVTGHRHSALRKYAGMITTMGAEIYGEPVQQGDAVANPLLLADGERAADSVAQRRRAQSALLRQAGNSVVGDVQQPLSAIHGMRFGAHQANVQ